MTFEEHTRHIDWPLTVGRRRTRQTARQAASTARRHRDGTTEPRHTIESLHRRHKQYRSADWGRGVADQEAITAAIACGATARVITSTGKVARLAGVSSACGRARSPGSRACEARGGVDGGHFGADIAGEVTQRLLIPGGRHHGAVAGGEGSAVA